MAHQPAAVRFQPLPRAVTSLVGREREIASVVVLLRNPVVRLVSITGPGGVGKTRLALAVAERMQADGADELGFVSLQATVDPSLLFPAIARSLNLREFGDRPLIDAVAEALSGPDQFLVLDNFEQLLDVAPWLSDLLVRCPGLTLLVTSRALLRISGEHDFPLLPLPVPAQERSSGTDDAWRSDAVRLFVERANAVRGDLALTQESAVTIASICARLDGLPLAIELAAARLRALTPEGLLERLERRLPVLSGGPRDAPARQQTIRDTIAWSYDLIPKDAQRLCRCLGVFTGGASLDAIEAVCGVDSDSVASGHTVLDGLTTLVDHSLARHREPPGGTSRFDMLETIREYALEQVDTHGETERVREQHARFYIDLALTAESEFFGPRQNEVFGQLEVELPNVRAALNWALDNDLEAGMTAAASLWYFWLIHAHFSEARSWLADAIERDGEVSATTRARALDVAASLASWQGDYPRGESLFREALRIFREIDDRRNIANTLRGMGRLAMASGDYERADLCGTESLAVFEELDDKVGVMTAAGNLGWNAFARGELDRGTSLLRRAQAIARERQDASFVANYGSGLGYLALARDDAADAKPFFTESLQLSWELDDRRFVAVSLAGLGSVAVLEGDPLRAGRLIASFVALRDAIGMPMIEEFLRPQMERDIVFLRSRLDPAALEKLSEEGRQMTLQEAVTYALTDELPEPLSRTMSSSGFAGLSPRELDVLRLVAQGKTDREIGAELFISHHTVMRHVSHILAKLDVDSRTAAAAYAVRHGIA